MPFRISRRTKGRSRRAKGACSLAGLIGSSSSNDMQMSYPKMPWDTIPQNGLTRRLDSTINVVGVFPTYNRTSRRDLHDDEILVRVRRVGRRARSGLGAAACVP